jgi:hypothetical protein
MRAPTQSPTGCEWAACSAAATHVITVDVPADGQRIWHVCSAHDKDVKRDVVRSRPQAIAPPATDGVSVAVHCGDCEIPLDEPSDLPAADRQPCPVCGSLRRQHRAVIKETMELHDSLAATVRRARAKKFAQKLKTGDDLTRATQTWGTRTLHLDRENDTYREEIVLHDGTRIESRAALHDHQGH